MKSRKGTAYAMTLTVCAVAATTAVSGLAFRASSADRGARISNLASARLLAQSGVESTLQRIADDTDWRGSLDELRTGARPFGNGTISVVVTDPADNDLSDDADEAYRVESTGRVADAAAQLRVDVKPASPGTYRDRVLASNPLVYWPLNEKRYVIPIAPLVGDPIGMFSSYNISGTTTGYDGEPASTLDSRSEFAFIPHHSSMLLDSGAVAFHFICNENVGGDQTILAKHNGNNKSAGGLHVCLHSSQLTLTIELSNSKSSSRIELGDIELKTWNHLAISFGPQGLICVLNGTAVKHDAAFTTGLGPGAGGSGNTEHVYVGGFKDGHSVDDSLMGSVRDLVIFKEQLTADQIGALVNPEVTFEIDPESWAWVVE